MTATPEDGGGKGGVGWAILEGVVAGLDIRGGGGRSKCEEGVDGGGKEEDTAFIGVVPFPEPPTRNGGGGGGGKSIEDNGSSEPAAGSVLPDVGALSNSGIRSIVS